MVVQLGAGFTTPQPPAPLTGDERRHVELLAELAAVKDALWALAQQGVPQVTVGPPDLSEIIYALEGLGVPALPVERIDPQQIGEAVANALDVRRVEDRTDEVLEELKRIGRKFGVALANSAPLVSQDITSRADRVLGRVESPSIETLLTAIRDLETATRDILTTVRDTVLRRTDPLPAGTSTIGHVTTSLPAQTLVNLPSAKRTTSGMEGPFAVDKLSHIAFDADITAVAGTAPELKFFVERKGADGIWYPVYAPAAITAVAKVITTVGQAAVVNHLLGSEIRLRWTVTGVGAEFTFSASMIGK